jgi:hypothetical protein
MTTEQIINRFKVIEKELNEIKIDIISVKEQLTTVVDIDTEIDKRVKNRKGTTWEIIRIVGLTIMILIFGIYVMIAFFRIDRKIDNIATPTGYIRGDKFIPFPSDSKVVRWPDNYQPQDTTK